MRYFYLKIGDSNSLAEAWLSGKNPINSPAGVIFFGTCTLKDIKAEDKTVPQQVMDFYESSLPENRESRIIAVIGHGKGWLLQPNSDLQEYHPDPTKSAVKVKTQN